MGREAVKVLRQTASRRRGTDTCALTPGDASAPKRPATSLVYRVGRTSACPRFFSSFHFLQGAHCQRQNAQSRLALRLHSLCACLSIQAYPSLGDTALPPPENTANDVWGGGDERVLAPPCGKSHTWKKQGQCSTFHACTGLTLTNPPSTADFSHSGQSNSPCWLWSLFVAACMRHG